MFRPRVCAGDHTQCLGFFSLSSLIFALIHAILHTRGKEYLVISLQPQRVTSSLRACKVSEGSGVRQQ